MKNLNERKIIIRKANDRGHANHGWLDSYHTFSFANYYDPKHMGFRSLRVINDDTVAPGMGFGKHPHRDMEIISYVIDGRLEHQDSMGHGSVIEAGHFQKITAGSGIAHSEFNHSKENPVHFLQIWIEPREAGLAPSYEELETKNLSAVDGLKLVGSPDGREKSFQIHQDAYLYFGELNQGEQSGYNVSDGRGIWIQMITGSIEVENQTLSKGDGLSLEGLHQVSIQANFDSQFLLFDLN